MAEKIKKGDFIELDYTAKVTDSGIVFDTTIEADAKKHELYNKEAKYKPLIVKVGEGQLVKGLDDFIVDKEPGKYNVDLNPEHAFGKKNAKLLRMVSIKEFHKNEIQPMPGLEVELDGYRGIVRAVSGGRVMVDFNHPLSSRDVSYDIHIKGIVTDPKLKVQAALELFKIPHENIEAGENKVIVTFKTKVPDEVITPIAAELKKLTGVDVEFK